MFLSLFNGFPAPFACQRDSALSEFWDCTQASVGIQKGDVSVMEPMRRHPRLSSGSADGCVVLYRLCVCVCNVYKGVFNYSRLRKIKVLKGFCAEMPLKNIFFVRGFKKAFLTIFTRKTSFQRYCVC